MKLKHTLIAIAVAAIWGVNFVLIRVGLEGVPPLALCAARFFLAAFPWIFLIPRPKTPWRYTVAYGLSYFGLQFALLFSAMHVGFPAGLSSLVLQTQVFFTMMLSALLFSDKPSSAKIFGAIVAFSGVALVGLRSSGEVTSLSLLLMLMAAFSFASGNMVSKKMGRTEPLSLVVWGSLVAFPVLFVASALLEGPTVVTQSFASISLSSVLAILYIVYLSTFLGFSLWNFLLNRYSPSTVSPFLLLVPVFGFVSSALILGETFSGVKIVASLLVVAGLAIGQFSGRKVAS